MEIEFARAALIDLDGSYFVQLIMFLLLWGILTPLVFKPYLKVKKVQEDLTTGREEEAKEIAAKAEQLLAEYSQRLKEARREGQQILTSLREEGRRARDEILNREREKLQTELQQKMQDVRKQEQELAARKAKMAQELSMVIREKVMEVEK